MYGLKNPIEPRPHKQPCHSFRAQPRGRHSRITLSVSGLFVAEYFEAMAPAALRVHTRPSGKVPEDAVPYCYYGAAVPKWRQTGN